MVQGGSVLYVCTKFETDSSYRSSVIMNRPATDPFPGAQDDQNSINQLEMVSTFTYRPTNTPADRTDTLHHS